MWIYTTTTNDYRDLEWQTAEVIHETSPSFLLLSKQLEALNIAVSKP